MSVWAVVVLWVVGVWLAGAVFTAGLLWEREHLQGNADVRAPGWWFAYLVSSLAWPVILPLWGSSRPALLPQPDNDDGYLGAVSQGEYIPPMRTVDVPRTLDQLASQSAGERVFITSMNVTVVREVRGALVGWRSEACTCWWNTLGLPVVLCRLHRNDLDQHGEPDESEEEVGR